MNSEWFFKARETTKGKAEESSMEFSKQLSKGLAAQFLKYFPKEFLKIVEKIFAWKVFDKNPDESFVASSEEHSQRKWLKYW